MVFDWLKRKIKIPQGMADLHNHVLPGIDDGAQDMESSVAMLRDFAYTGYSAVAVSCHLGHPRYDEVSADRIREGVRQVQQELDQQGIAIRLYPGAEIYCDERFEERLQQGSLLPIGGTGPFYLIEFALRDPMLRMKELAFALQLQGIRPILAHPERYEVLHRKPHLLREWKQAGWLMQLDLCSLLQEDGRDVYKLSLHFLREQSFDIAASDLHGPTGKVRQMVESLAHQVGAVELEQLLVINPHRILQGLEPLPFDDYDEAA